MNSPKTGSIVCIHGNSSSANYFSCLVDDSTIQHPIITLELKGHGANQIEEPQVSDFLFESQKKALIQQIDALKDNVLLIGHSLGGHLAMEIAPMLKNLSALVVMGAPPIKKPMNVQEAIEPNAALNVFFEEEPDEHALVEAIRSCVVESSIVPAIVADFKAAHPLVRKAAALNVMQGNLGDEFSLFTQLEAPRYIIASDSDPAVRRSYLTAVQKACMGSCSIFDIENCGHYHTLEQPKVFNSILKSILSEVFES